MSDQDKNHTTPTAGRTAAVVDRIRAFLAQSRREFTLPLRPSTYARAEGRPLYARLLYGLAIPVVVLWVLLAVGLNVFVPQLERVVEQNTLSFLPDDAPSVQALSNMSKHFGHGGSNNAVAVLLEGQRPLGEDSHRFYADLVAKFDADKDHIIGMIDVWSNPMLAPAAESSDKKASYLYLYLDGNIGSAQGLRSTQAVRDIIASAPAPAGVKVYLTGPATVVNDELVAISQSTMRVIIACALLVTLIMFVTYRSPITGGGPLLVVVIALLSARQIVALLSSHHVISVSGFASSLLAGVVLGAGTNYGIFLLGRYQEARRAGEDPTTAYYSALSGVQHVVVASGLTVASATACLAFTRLAIFSSSGLPCTIGVVTTLAAALTLGPAMLALASRFGLYEPRGKYSTRRWRRIATRVVRWPGPVLAASIAVLAIATLILPTYVVSYDERAAQPRSTEANMGLVAADRHLPPDILNPSLLFVESDHDMRNPADLIALAKLTNAVFAVDGVRAVQGITRPLIGPLPQSTLTYQAGYISQRIVQTTKVATARLQDVAALSDRVGQLSTVVQNLQGALDTAQGGFNRSIQSGQDLQKQLVDVVTKARSIRNDAQPLTQSADQLLGTIPNCNAIQYCNAAATGLSLIDNLDKFDEHKFQDLLDGVQVASASLPQLGIQIRTLGSFLTDMQRMLAPLRGLLEALGPQVSEIAQFAKEVADSFSSGDPSASFFIPSQAFQSPLFKSALPYFFSPDGKITRIVVMGEVNAFSRESMDYTARIIPAAKTALKSTSLSGSKVSLGGAGGTLLNIAAFAKEDFITSAIASFALVFCIILILLRSIVAALTVVGTVGLSYLAGLGLSVGIWQHIIGQPLHWAVAPCAFIILVAVGADYNLLLVDRFKQELHSGINTGIIRSMVGTGRVVTIAGLVFGTTMLAMTASYSSTFAQIGTTVAIGLFLDALVVRSLIIPAIATLLGRWFWWPIPIPGRPRSHSRSSELV